MVMVMVRISKLIPSVRDRVKLGLGLGLQFDHNNLITLTQKLSLTLTLNTNPVNYVTTAREPTVEKSRPVFIIMCPEFISN